MKFKIYFFICLQLLIVHQINGQAKTGKTTKQPLTIGETVTIHSNILDEDRILNIYLPQTYKANATTTYPVIYLLDGSIEEDFIHITGIVQFGSFSWVNMLPKSIVVGIANVDRRRDFTYPTTIAQDKKDFPSTGSSKKFIEFIETELQPYIDANYKVTEEKTIIGQSLGGLLATEILYTTPDLFDNYIIVSPSLWWDNQSILKLKPKEHITEKKIFIGVGKEGDIMERDAKTLFTTLKANAKENTKLHFKFFEKQDHGDALHLAVYKAFEMLFEKQAN
ncbi:alpha/beta hydrolase [Winogradskyella ursingii]|uniref:alpha/beta hydrolase n=1 Tax=Winogradskyella ursingii TaxID=2686079 RepID=UPI0015CAD3F2|nr:alpha/beta hydrolase-fold protein [Winogradskyella ursingii]